MADRKRYRVVASLTISVHTDVEAENEEQAQERAQGIRVMSLCHQCASEDGEGQWVTSGELDGDPEEILEVEELEPKKRGAKR